MDFTNLDTLEKLDHALHYWRDFSFDSSYIKLQDAIDGLNQNKPLAEARMEYYGRWTMCVAENKLGNEDAIFHTAAVWVWNSDMQTGNFVPAGQAVQSKIPEARLQHHANALCQFSYAVDTANDKALYDAQKVFEAHITKQSAFNRGRKPRRKWQEGTGSFDSTYIFTAPLFVRRGTPAAKREPLIDYPLHPWVESATVPGTQFCANPDRPHVFEVVHGALQNIADCAQPELRYGDLVWMSFVVEFIVGTNAWNPNFIPVEIIRVGSVATELVGHRAIPDTAQGAGDALPTRRQRLQAGQACVLNSDFPMFDTPSSAVVVAPTSAKSTEHLPTNAAMVPLPAATVDVASRDHGSTPAVMRSIPVGPPTLVTARAASLVPTSQSLGSAVAPTATSALSARGPASVSAGSSGPSQRSRAIAGRLIAPPVSASSEVPLAKPTATGYVPLRRLVTTEPPSVAPTSPPAVPPDDVPNSASDAVTADTPLLQQSRSGTSPLAASVTPRASDSIAAAETTQSTSAPVIPPTQLRPLRVNDQQGPAVPAGSRADTVQSQSPFVVGQPPSLVAPGAEAALADTQPCSVSKSHVDAVEDMSPYDIELASPPLGNALPLPEWPDSTFDQLDHESQCQLLDLAEIGDQPSDIASAILPDNIPIVAWLTGAASDDSAPQGDRSPEASTVSSSPLQRSPVKRKRAVGAQSSNKKTNIVSMEQTNTAVTAGRVLRSRAKRG